MATTAIHSRPVFLETLRYLRTTQIRKTPMCDCERHASHDTRVIVIPAPKTDRYEPGGEYRVGVDISDEDDLGGVIAWIEELHGPASDLGIELLGSEAYVRGLA